MMGRAGQVACLDKGTTGKEAGRVQAVREPVGWSSGMDRWKNKQ